LSVIHPVAVPYFREFLSSLEKQTRKDFTLFLINDGVKGVEKIIETFDLNVLVRIEDGKPGSIRKKGIEWIRTKVDQIIFADTDDCFKENRIETSQDLLSKHDIVFNELMLFGEKINGPFPMLNPRLHDGAEILESDIMHSNCLGLSNTAINTRYITRSLDQLPDEIIAFDWAFYFLCLHEGAKAVFTEHTVTYYRQYEDNIAFSQSFTEDQILRGLKIKLEHYRFISRIDPGYLPISKRFEKTMKTIRDNELSRDRYCSAVKDQAPESPLWWESIKTLEELGL